jgi:hypothetical protein
LRHKRMYGCRKKRLQPERFFNNPYTGLTQCTSMLADKMWWVASGKNRFKPADRQGHYW